MCAVPIKLRSDGRRALQDGVTALGWAAHGGHLETVRELVKGGAYLESVDNVSQNDGGKLALDERCELTGVVLCRMGALLS